MKSQIQSVIFTAGVAAVMAAPVFAAPLSEAQITHIIKDVRTVDREKTARPSKLREVLHSSQAVRTGIESRTELLFNDKTLTRIGANSHFSFTEGTRNLELYRGVILLQVPKGAGGARIRTAAVTAAVTGTTILMEAGPGYSKFIVLEGKAYLTATNDKSGKKTAVKAGQAVIMPNAAKQVPPPVVINLAVLVKTSRLISGAWPVELNAVPITAAIAQQTPENFLDTNLAIIGPGTAVVFLRQLPVIRGKVDDPPSKFGPLPTIPRSYVIKNGTKIKTDPTITTDGVVEFGKIYQGKPAEDGAATPTEFVFGNGAAPQPAFDNEFNKLNQPAVFRFESLQLQAGPDIDATDGPTDLVLASLGAITSGGAGAQSVNLSSLDSLTLAALGPISLNSALTIRGADTRLWLTNHGSGNAITVNSAINLSALRIDSAGNLSVGGKINIESGIWNSGGDLKVSAPVTASSSLKLQSAGNAMIDGPITTPSFDLKLTGDLSGAGMINAGRIVIDSRKPLSLSQANGLSLNGVGIGTGPLESLEITAGPLTLTRGGINLPGLSGISLPAVDLVLNGDVQVQALADASIGARNLTLANLTAPGDVTLVASGDLTLQGNLTASGGILLLENRGVGSNLSLNGAVVTNAVFAQLSSFGGSGSIDAREVHLALTDVLTVSDGKVNGVSLGLDRLQSLELTAGAITLTSGGINLPGVDLVLNGTVQAPANATLTARNLTLANLTAPGNLTLTSSGDLTLQGDLTASAGLLNLNNGGVGSSLSLNGAVVADRVSAGLSSFGGSGSIDARVVSLVQSDVLTVSDGKVNGVSLGLGQMQSLFLSSFTFTNYGNFDAPNLSLVHSGPTLINGIIRVREFSLGGLGIFSGGTVDAQTLKITTTLPGVDGTFIKNGASSASFNALTLDLTRTTTLNFRVIGNLTANVSSGFTNNPAIDFEGASGIQLNGDFAVGSLIASSSAGPILVGGKINALQNVTLSAATNILDTSDLPADQDHISGQQITISVGAGPAIFSQTAPTRVGYGPLRLDLARTTNLTLSANPTQIVGNISLPGIVLTVDGVIQTSAINNSNSTFAAPPSFNGPHLAFDVDSLLLGSTPLANGGIQLSGGDAESGGDSGSGGAFSVNAQGDVTVNAPITATTGRNADSTKTAGAGGSVDLTSQNGTIAVNSAIEVSSKDSVQRRKSAKGGNIRLTSKKTTGTAITINSTGELKALLDAAAPGPGGTITFTSDGGDILVTGGKVTADRGTIVVRNHGSAGLVKLNSATLAADVVKIGALGENGVLRIGGGAIDANTTIKLYAGGSNGTVDFVDDVSLSGSSVKSIAARTVNISNGKVVTVRGPTANVYTSNPNYTGSGGNGSKTGTFGGSGAITFPHGHPGKPPF